MKIMFVLNERTRWVKAELCDNDTTLEQANGMWSALLPNRAHEKVVAISNQEFAASDLVGGKVIAASEEAFSLGTIFGANPLPML